ncbi:serine/threonine-protein kinase [Pyxidicoccus sp. MSG2]|uniref:serine/threonine-protein kinase n=1 Tax=Pyxidicoccus sp. MSG2 TaxID=2996790 RepID=UPI002271C174|nr:serine/threonine protein kinase [Pyxidicoccus sp. MSG2]MCY1018329.1 protein kinase [Pyxidicoccus sp. MSG2]
MADSATDPLLSTKVGEYIVQERIGSGGMGVVYRAVHPLIGKQVAIKVLRAELVSQQQVERLLIEGRAVNAIHHPGIIDIFGFGDLPDGRPYITMELLRGHSLSALIRKQGRLDVSTTIRILDEMLAALGAAHQAGVVHRDLKPGNVFMVEGRDGSHSVKLVDFGIAKLVQSHDGPTTLEGTILGTPEFMAPEQIRGAPSSPSADLYAVGVIAFQMLTGERPFKGEPFQVLFAHVEQPAPVPSSKAPGIPPELDTLVLHLLAKEPALRPQSAEAVRQALQRVPLSQGVVPRASLPVTPVSEAETSTLQVETPSRPSNARHGRRWLAGALLLATLGGSTYFVWPRTPDEAVPTTKAQPEVRAEVLRPDAPTAQPTPEVLPPAANEPDVAVPSQGPEAMPPDAGQPLDPPAPTAASQPSAAKKAPLQGPSRESAQTSKGSSSSRQTATPEQLEQLSRLEKMFPEVEKSIPSGEGLDIGRDLKRVSELAPKVNSVDDLQKLQAELDALQVRLNGYVQEKRATGTPDVDKKPSPQSATGPAHSAETDEKPDPFKQGQLDFLEKDKKKLQEQAGSSPVDSEAMKELEELFEKARRMQTREERLALKDARKAWEKKYLRNQ